VNLFKDKDSRAGLYITVIFHLTVIIALLLYQIDSTVRKEESFVLDFSKQEEIERLKKEEEFKEDISKRLDDLIAAARSSSKPIRNIAVDAGNQLKDDRGTDAEQLYKDAAKLAADLKNGTKDAIEEDAREETVEMQHQRKPTKEEQKEYSGPSVVSYTLDGRKASHLKIPAYRCYGSGDVTVIITVNNAGVVTAAKVMDDISSDDACLRNFAVRAARLSRFSASQTAPPNQKGEILYRFIAQ
jgi:cell division protein FtsB